MNKLTKLVGAAAILTLLPACSTIVNGTNQSIKFNTAEVEGAKCMLSGGSDNAVAEKFTSPAEVEVPRSKKPLQLECNKSGYQTANQVVTSQVEETTGGNLLLGGFIGAGVDAATGALYRYPSAVSLVMTKLGMTKTDENMTDETKTEPTS